MPREAVRRTRRERPFAIDGWVVLPEQVHGLMIQPEGDDAFSNRIRAFKIHFVRAVPLFAGRRHVGSRSGHARGDAVLARRSGKPV